jgi:hypothetical protein
MPNISDMNIILGQASAIKQMQTIPALAADHNAQLAAQAAAALLKREQERIQNVKPGEKPELNKGKKQTQDKAESNDPKHLSRRPRSSGGSAAGRIVDIQI